MTIKTGEIPFSFRAASSDRLRVAVADDGHKLDDIKYQRIKLEEALSPRAVLSDKPLTLDKIHN